MNDPRAWLAGRNPRPPAALELTVAAGVGELTDLLTDAGAAALARALSQEGERRGAFDLLAADGLLTYACEAAVASPDPDAALLGIVERLTRRDE